MVKNLHGGNKHKKFKNKNPHEQVTKTTIRAEYNQLYAKVLKRMGNNRVSVICSDGETRSCSIPGKYRRKLWLNPDDILLVDIESHGTNNNNICMMNHKYNSKDIDSLKQENLLNKIEFGNENENNISYSDSEIVESSYDVYDISSEESSNELFI